MLHNDKAAEMSATEYQSWVSRRGGRTMSAKKARSLRRNARKPRPGRKAFFRHARRLALTLPLDAEDSRLVQVIRDLCHSATFPCNEARARKLLAAARRIQKSL